uniref:Digestive organ expansion factor-like protein n=1 Tax=Anopheles minimus TaxID=112268 RepID=A0A182W238_9DIPT
IQAQKRQIEESLQQANASTDENAIGSSDSEEDVSEMLDDATFARLSVKFNNQIGQVIGRNDDTDVEEEEVEEEDGDSRNDDTIEDKMEAEPSVQGLSYEIEQCDSGLLLENEVESAESQYDKSDVDLFPDDPPSGDDEATTNDPYILHTAYNLSPSMLETLAAEPRRVQTSTMSFLMNGQGHHAIKLTVGKTMQKPNVSEEPTVGRECRDQGFVRPEVLIIVPFRESALQCVSLLKRLFADEQEKGTLLLSAFQLPEFRLLYNKHFHNYRVLPQARTVAMTRCLIYNPSYIDFVRLRNYFKKEELSFTQICEYTTDAEIGRARDIHRIRGIRHLILYASPIFPHFYPELVNLMMKENQNPHDGVEDASMTVTS